MQETHRQTLLESLNLPLHDPLIQIIRRECLEGNIHNDQWTISRSQDQMWLNFRQVSVELPEQGWKLHISADLSSAEAVFQCILPLLLQKAISFKCISSLDNLRLLNSGQCGLSQIGKFATIYSRNDDEAVSVAALLDEATRGLSGPQIPSDRMLYPGSLVFYRYAGYTTTYMQEKTGRVFPAIRTLDNQLVPDIRSRKYQAPEQRVDPFLLAGIATDLPQPSRILGQRYLIVSVISASINHTVSMAIDLNNQCTCIIKSSGRSWQNKLPQSEREWAYQEGSVLQALAGHTRIPAFLDFFEQENDIALVMSDIPGQVLMECIHGERVSGQISFQQIIAWGCDLAEVLEGIHQRGFVYADLKPTNVIIGPDEKLYVIDFELANRSGALDQAKRGTPGYMSPQQFAGQPRSIADDIYSFGALLYLLVTSVEPSQAPDPFALLKRPVEYLRPDVPSAITEIIARCLQEQPEARYASMSEVRAALDAALNDQDRAILLSGNALIADEASSKARSREIAMELLHTLCTTAKIPAGGVGLTWKTSHPLANNYALRDLNAGLAGTVLALAGLVAELADPGARSVLARSAHWLRRTQPHSDPPLPGLYIGEAGVGAALLLAGQVLADSTLIADAIERGRLIATLPHTSPDIMHGTAGRLLFHLLLWEETGMQEHLAAALACGEQLLESAQRREQGELCWALPATFEGFSQEAYPGYAHGVAGIADALLDLFEVTGDERFVIAIQGAAKWLQRLAIPVLADRSGLSWSVTEDKETPFSPFWCHGSAGIGRFFLHASRHAWVPATLETALGAAQSVIHLARSGGPVLCHGLAGGIEFLLDMYQETREQCYLEEAQTFGRLLEAFAATHENLLVFHSDQLHVFSPDYQVGYAGIAISFLRLSVPDRIPYQLSRAGFRAYKRRVETESTVIKR